MRYGCVCAYLELADLRERLDVDATAGPHETRIALPIPNKGTHAFTVKSADWGAGWSVDGTMLGYHQDEDGMNVQKAAPAGKPDTRQNRNASQRGLGRETTHPAERALRASERKKISVSQSDRWKRPEA